MLGACLAAGAFFTLVGLPIARALAPRGVPPLALAPALGWAVFMVPALFWLTATGLGRIPILVAILAAPGLAALAWRRAPPPTARLPAWALAIAASLCLLPLLAIMPKHVPGGLLFGPPIYDHVKIAVVDAILRAGLPVTNPFYGPSGPGTLAYYYLWHAGAAVLAAAVGLGGWAAEAAMTGFTAFAALSLTMGLAVAMGARRAGIAAVALLSLAGSLRPVLVALAGPATAEGLIPASADIGGWLNQAAWVPQHLQSACCLILAALLLVRLAEAGGWVAALALALVMAGGFESSIWIGGFAWAASGMALGLGLLCRAGPGRRVRFVRLAGGAAALAALLALPFATAYLGAARSHGGGGALAVAPYAVLGGLVPAAWRAALGPAAFWLVLLPFAFPAILPLGVAGFRARWSDDGLARHCAIVAIACLGVAWLLRSTIDNNDLGWRAALPAVLLLTAGAGAGLQSLVDRRGWLALGACLAAAALGLPDGARMARDYALGQRPGDPAAFAGLDPAWEAVRRHAGKLDRVANNPLAGGLATPWPVNLPWALWSDRPSCYAGWSAVLAYGAIARPGLIEVQDRVARLFAGTPAPGDADDLARRDGCAVVLVTPRDAAWSADPFAGSTTWRLADLGAAWRIYARRPSAPDPP